MGSTASRECSLILASTPSRAPSTTCPSPQPSTENQTCRSFYTSLSLIPPDPRLLLTSFPILPKNLAPCWTTPSSDCENRNVILSLFETMVILSSILKKCEISTYFCFVLCWCCAAVRKSTARGAEYQSWLT